MNDDKFFLTYNQQMRKLRNDKHILCAGSSHKKILIRAGYFNIVNGYKAPFISGKDAFGNHTYISDTSITQLHAVKKFDDELRSLLLKYITQVEEETRTLAGYKFDECNDNGRTPWYDTTAYSPNKSLQQKMNVISKAYSELSKSQLDYVKFYMDNHKQIPTWIMIKVVNFSTFIDIIRYSKIEVSTFVMFIVRIRRRKRTRKRKTFNWKSPHGCGKFEILALITKGIYCLSRKKDSRGQSGRILEKYLRSLSPGYSRNLDQKIFDLIVYFKYYLPKIEYKQFISEFKNTLTDLQTKIHPHAFEYVRGQIGIRNISDLDLLIALPKDEIEYNKFDKQDLF